MSRPAAGCPFWSRTVAVTREVLNPSATITSGLAVSVTDVPCSDGPMSSGTSTPSKPQPA